MLIIEDNWNCVLPKVTEDVFKKYMIIFEGINHLISLRWYRYILFHFLWQTTEC